MTIDPKLFEKYTGRRPGEAMNEYGKSLAGAGPRSGGDTSFLGSIYRGRMILRLIVAIVVLVGIVYLLFGGRII